MGQRKNDFHTALRKLGLLARVVRVSYSEPRWSSFLLRRGSVNDGQMVILVPLNLVREKVKDSG